MVCIFEFLTLFTLRAIIFLILFHFLTIFSAPNTPIRGVQILFGTRNNEAFTLDSSLPWVLKCSITSWFTIWGVRNWWFSGWLPGSFHEPPQRGENNRFFFAGSFMKTSEVWNNRRSFYSDFPPPERQQPAGYQTSKNQNRDPGAIELVGSNLVWSNSFVTIAIVCED
jgi:hypothetical protein